MFGFDVLDLSRAQFAMTAMFHILWPILTISLSLFLFVVEALWVRGSDPMYYRHARFWGKLLLLNFAVGVVTGIPLEFQFGTNWAAFSHSAGQFIGNILGFEGAMAFMLEAGFIGVMMFGWGRVSKRVHLFATGMVAFGSTISSFWIMVANSWMQTPAGVSVVDGKIIVTDYVAAIFNPSMAWAVAHMWVAAVETGLFVIAGISAYYLFKRRDPEFFARSFKLALMLLIFIAPLQVALGDSSGVDIFKNQPAKGAAIEGHWHTNAPGQGAAWSLLAWPNQEQQKNDWSIEVPGMLSLIATHDPTGKITGLADIARADQPPALPLLYYAFRIMAGIGMWLVLLSLWTAYVWLRASGGLTGLLTNRKLLLAWVLTIPLPYIAVECGWIVREVGRQPWIVTGILRTRDAVSNVPAQTVAGSMAMFLVFYVVLLISFVVFARKWLKQGPDLTIMPPSDAPRPVGELAQAYD